MRIAAPVKVRQLDAQDEDYILDSFLKSYRHSIDVQSVPNHIYFHSARKLFSRIYMQAEFRVACHKDDESDIFGWLAYTPISTDFTAVWWMNTKINFRRFGIAKLLCEPISGTKILYPFRSEHTVWIRQRALATFNPFLVHEVLK